MTKIVTEIPTTAPIWSETLSIMASTQPYSKYTIIWYFVTIIILTYDKRCSIQIAAVMILQFEGTRIHCFGI